MRSDIDIAQGATLKPIKAIAKSIGIIESDLIPYGHHIAKLSPNVLAKQAEKQNGKLILVTAISPTPAGEGKTTTTVGLTDALNLALKDRQKQAMLCIREPSLGPVFGIKGGAAGGGYAQVVPMENINLHFTGDFHAITSANNLLAALVDNHIYHGNSLNIDPATISWRRCLDMNDRALRRVTLNTIQKDHQLTQSDTGFDISVASEVMAIFCLADSLSDLTKRLGNIQVALNQAQQPIYAKDLKAEGAMTALLKDAFQPNLVQTLAHSPAIVHGGPFANIAHGCNSVVATKTALKLADYVVTEAGFGADLGAEKFMNIKCRQTGLNPDAVVLVATIRALKFHGGVAKDVLNDEDLTALNAGLANIKKHIENLTQHFGLKVVVAINHFDADTPAEIDLLKDALGADNVEVVLCKHWAEGGQGALDLANKIIGMVDASPSQPPQLLYPNHAALEEKIKAVATKLYGAGAVEFSDAARKTMAKIDTLATKGGVADFPVCIAKTQYSFSSDPTLRGAPKGHSLKVRDLRLVNGAGFIVVICGDVMTMPGLPMQPASEHIAVDASGMIVGLS